MTRKSAMLAVIRASFFPWKRAGRQLRAEVTPVQVRRNRGIRNRRTPNKIPQTWFHRGWDSRLRRYGFSSALPISLRTEAAGRSSVHGRVDKTYRPQTFVNNDKGQRMEDRRPIPCRRSSARVNGPASPSLAAFLLDPSWPRWVCVHSIQVSRFDGRIGINRSVPVGCGQLPAVWAEKNVSDRPSSLVRDDVSFGRWTGFARRADRIRPFRRSVGWAVASAMRIESRNGGLRRRPSCGSRNEFGN
jgi:hypothetical protein